MLLCYKFLQAVAAPMLWLAGKAHKFYGLGAGTEEALQVLQHKGVSYAATFKSNRFFQLRGRRGRLSAMRLFALLGLKVSVRTFH